MEPEGTASTGENSSGSRSAGCARPCGVGPQRRARGLLQMWTAAATMGPTWPGAKARHTPPSAPWPGAEQSKLKRSGGEGLKLQIVDDGDGDSCAALPMANAAWRDGRV